MEQIFEWDRVLLNGLPFHYLLEVLFRSTVMFIILLLTLRATGKRGVKELSVFETVIIIALGSAAGDPMFYEDVGLLPATAVFVVILLLYRLVTWLTGKSKRFETFIEGKTECLVHEGKFSVKTFKKESLAQDEFFAELRLKSVEHLGQLKYAYIETSGEISTFFYEDKEVRYGLPILPQLFSERSRTISGSGPHACTFCGNVEKHARKKQADCGHCGKDVWVQAIDSKRIS